ncbi:hypothetical protein [Salinibaculum rarum]|uniref:hypothetical protein n=1 Tax=Salinibaculum rarum TaxID=3058903 RepID=UPI00266002B7|nr:hypothetical protein [Salinibaculum sp. KK48]
MDWRCEWCGKPHEENDPPCDNCGHGAFEKAVVRRTDLADDGALESTTVWVCTECGRTHTKHSPPCSRCGNHKLVREEQRVDDDELSVPSYLDLLTPRYVLGLVVVLVLAGVFLGGLTGVLDVPGFGNEVPEVENVPGDPDTAGSMNLTNVETAYLDSVNDARANASDGRISRNDRLDEVAEYTNRRLVKSEYGDGSLPSRDHIAELVGDSCQSGFTLESYTVRGGNYTSGDALGSAFASKQFADSKISAASTTTVGMDVHTAPDGTVFLTQIVC